MKKTVWIWNHYATNMFFDEAGRHYWFAQYLKKKGYNPTIFCASTNHFSQNHIDTKKNKYLIDFVTKIPFVFIKTLMYMGNDKKRIINMVLFYRRLLKTAKEYAKLYGKPDVILASSVHPLTLIAGIKVAKKFGIPCISEVRDLWPESLVAYGVLKRNSYFTQLLYQGEKWIYKKSDSIIMTWEGGAQYIKDRSWDKHIDIKKVQYISNGVSIKDFDENIEKYDLVDLDLDDKNFKNIVYTGSIRKVNNLGILLDAAKIVSKIDEKIRIIIYGSGDEKDILEKRCSKEGIDNVIFKGRVDKNKIPSILNKSYANILHNSSTTLDKYGQSQNKFFEYLAAGKCIIQTYTTEFSILEKYNCGISVFKQEPKEIAKVIIEVCSDEKKVRKMGLNARKAAIDFDFEKLTNKLIKVIENQ